MNTESLEVYILCEWALNNAQKQVVKTCLQRGFATCVHGPLTKTKPNKHLYQN